MNLLTKTLFRSLALFLAFTAATVTYQADAQTGTINQASMPVGTIGANDWQLFYKWNGQSGGSAKWFWEKEGGYDFLGQFTNSYAGQTMWGIMTNIDYRVFTNVAAIPVTIRSNSLAIFTNSLMTYSNAVQAAWLANSNAIVLSNSVMLAAVNANSNLLTQSTNFSQSFSNSVESQIALINAGLGGTVSSGGNATLGNVIAKSFTAPFYKTVSTNAGTISVDAQNGSGANTLSFDLSNWQVVKYLVSGSSGAALDFAIINPSDGQNISIVLSASLGSTSNFGFSSTAPTGYTIVFASNFTSAGTGKGAAVPAGTSTFVLNAEVVGTTIYCSGGKF